MKAGRDKARKEAASFARSSVEDGQDLVQTPMPAALLKKEWALSLTSNSRLTVIFSHSLTYGERGYDQSFPYHAKTFFESRRFCDGAPM
jgi:hypothetical protein